MTIRRLVVAIGVAGALLASAAGPAAADPAPNDHNCNGVFFSSRAPGTQRGGQQGERAREQAQAGTRGEVLRANTEFRANCGANP